MTEWPPTVDEIWEQTHADTTDVLERWADCHGTSCEIAKALIEYVIHTTPRPDRPWRTVEDIWNDPTPEEEAKVMARAWAHADPHCTELFWGCERKRKPEMWRHD